MTSGKSKSRFNGHRSAANKGYEYPVARAWRRHGEPTIEVLCIGSFEYIADLEQKAISSFNCLVPNGYNVALGGNGVMIGRKHSEASKLAMSIGHSGKVLSEEHKLRIGAASAGKSLSDSCRKKMSAARKGKSNTESQKQHKKAIVDGVEYQSTRKAFEALGLPVQSHNTFRKKLSSSSMSGNFVHNGKIYHFILELK